MRIGIFDPYLDTLGGGEKYIFSIFSCLSDNHEVSLFWDDNSILGKAKERFGPAINNLKIKKNIFSSKTFLPKRILETKKYDVIFYISDGSVPILLSSNNILIFQFPVNWVDGKKLSTKLKLKRIKRVVCYSDFVKKFIDKTFATNAMVLPPLVESVKRENIKRENIILTVGRFTKAVNTKKQEVLIDTFKKLCDEGLSGWEFIVIGSVLPSDKGYVEELKKRSKNYSIKILDNISFNSLVDYYNKAKIYWHAAGFGEDLEKHPEKAEHFGISTVEAMSTGAVPIVFNGGGQPEIVQNNISGFLWTTKKELEKMTMDLINEKNLNKISVESEKRAKYFAGNNFCDQMTKLINV